MRYFPSETSPKIGPNRCALRCACALLVEVIEVVKVVDVVEVVEVVDVVDVVEIVQMSRLSRMSRLSLPLSLEYSQYSPPQDCPMPT